MVYENRIQRLVNVRELLGEPVVTHVQLKQPLQILEFLRDRPANQFELMWKTARSASRPSSSGRNPAMSPWLRSMLSTAAKEAALEKQVEDLTLQLEFEKRMRADLEEAKIKENVKLRSFLEQMELEVQETKELLTKELPGKFKEIADAVKAITEENAKLKSALLEEMRVREHVRMIAKF
nr:myosin-6 isoform X2 [Ipomoea batatas]